MTLALALAGFALSVVSLGWQIWTFRTSGARIKVEQSMAIAAITDTPDTFFCVTARNVGRGAASVHAWGLRAPTGRNFVATRFHLLSSTLPTRLEGGEKADYYFDQANVERLCHAEGVDSADLRGWVELGSGKQEFASAFKKRAPG